VSSPRAQREARIETKEIAKAKQLILGSPRAQREARIETV